MKKILIVEDDFTIQAQRKTLLSGNGYEVFAVTEFSQTIQQIKAFNPHLVILDIKLPGNNGFEICSKIRTFSYVHIVFVTSSNTDMDELNSIMLGATLLLQSPTTPQSCLLKCRTGKTGIPFFASRIFYMEWGNSAFCKQCNRIQRAKGRFVNHYMLQQKQKEFAIQSIMGMEQKTIGRIFFAETMLME